MLHRPERILNGAGCHFRRSGAELHRVHVCVNAAGAQRKDGVAVHLGMHRTDGAGVAIVGAGSHAQGLRLGQHCVRGDYADGGILAGGGTDLQHFRDGRTAVEQMVAQHRLAVGQMAAGQYLISIGFVNVAAGVDRVLTMDLHANQIQGFFDIPVDNLFGNPIFVDYYAKKFGAHCEDMVVVSPDVGSVARARTFAQKLHMNLAIVDKRRQKANQCEVMNVIGDVEGKECILFDDMVDTAGSLCNAAKAVVEVGGAKKVYACASHGVLSGPALERLAASSIEELALLDTIPAPAGEEELAKSRIKYLTVAPMFAEAIERTYQEISIAKLFN